MPIDTSWDGTLRKSVALAAACLLAVAASSHAERNFVAAAPSPSEQRAQASHAVGPAGWDVGSLAVHPDGTIYAGYDRGVLISVDKGARWVRRSQGLPEGPADSIALGPDGAVYVGSDSIFRTADQGRSWRPTGKRTVARDQGEFLTVLAAGNDIYAAEGRWVYRSVDQGATWTRTARPATARMTSLAVGRDGTLWAGTFEGVFKSVDKGRRWARVSDAFREDVIQVIALEDSLFAVVITKGVFKSTDGGANWLAANRGLPPPSAMGEVWGLYAARDGALYAGFGLAIYKSNDNAARWEATGAGIEPVNGWVPGESSYGTYVQSFAETQDGTIFVGTRDGIYKSANKGARWTRLLLLTVPES